jgi:two-component system response regulator HydG
MGRRIETVPSGAMDALVRYPWPGNVRELIHLLEQVVVLTDSDTIGIEDLPESIRGTARPAATPSQEIPTLREVQRRHTLWVLEQAAGNRVEAARLLGTSERTFYRLLERYRRDSARPASIAKAPPSKHGT